MKNILKNLFVLLLLSNQLFAKSSDNTVITKAKITVTENTFRCDSENKLVINFPELLTYIEISKPALLGIIERVPIFKSTEAKGFLSLHERCLKVKTHFENKARLNNNIIYGKLELKAIPTKTFINESYKCMLAENNIHVTLEIGSYDPVFGNFNGEKFYANEFADIQEVDNSNCYDGR